MEKKETIYVNQKGFESHLKAIEDLKERRSNLRFNKQFEVGSSDSWHYEKNYEENMLATFLSEQITILKEQIKRMVIVDDIEDENIVDIGDVVVVDIYYANEKEELTFKLVSTITLDKKDIEEVSVKSLLGNAIYQKKVSEKVSYKVDNEQVEVLIKRKLDLIKKEDKVKRLTK